MRVTMNYDQPTTGTKPMNIQQILDDPSTSYWLRDALTTSLNRDPVDALNDVDILLEACEKRLADIQNLHSNR